jgi:hypothetical protein
MSQKPFMWNDNNPVEYQDPSGYETQCDGCQGLPPPNAAPMPAQKEPANTMGYTKLEVVIGGGAVSITRLDNGHLYVGGGAGSAEPSASLSRGKVYPNKGKTADDVAVGWSGGGGGGAIFGVEVWGNQSGIASGLTLTTPGGAGAGTDARLVGGYTQSPNSAQPGSKKQHTPTKPN